MKRSDALSTNPIIAKLEEAAEFDSVLEFEGYIGSSKAELVRIYSDFTLRHYLEVHKEDILHLIDVADDKDGRKRLFIPASAKVRNVTVERSTADAVFAPAFSWAMIRICALTLDEYNREKKYLDEHGDELSAAERMRRENELLDSLLFMQQNCPLALQPFPR